MAKQQKPAVPTTPQEPKQHPLDAEETVSPNIPELPIGQNEPKPKAKPAEIGVHSEQDLEDAEVFEISPVDVYSMTPAQLKAEIRKRQNADIRSRRDQRLIDDQRMTGANRQQRSAPEPQQSADDLPFNTEGHDPQVLEFLRGLKKQNEELRSQLEETGQREQRRTMQTAVDRIDDAFASMGEEALDYYGALGGMEMKPTMPEFIRRNVLITAAGIDLKNVPSTRVLLARLKAADKILRPSAAKPQARAEQEPDGDGEGMPYGRRVSIPENIEPERKRDRLGRFLPPSEDDWANGMAMRPSGRRAPDGEDRGHSGFADPDEFDLQ